LIVNKQRRKSTSGSILKNTSSIDGLPEYLYKQSIQNLTKRQLSNTTANSTLEADKDVIEIDLDEERNDPLFNLSNDTNQNYQSPVYPALFLNDIIGQNDDLYDEDNHIHTNTSVYQVEENDYFGLCKYPCQGKK
jgi:hypothetical protein